MYIFVYIYIDNIDSVNYKLTKQLLAVGVPTRRTVGAIPLTHSGRHSRLKVQRAIVPGPSSDHCSVPARASVVTSWAGDRYGSHGPFSCTIELWKIVWHSYTTLTTREYRICVGKWIAESKLLQIKGDLLKMYANCNSEVSVYVYIVITHIHAYCNLTLDHRQWPAIN